MPPPKQPATQAQLAAFGHIAARLRQFMAERQWKPSDLNEALGRHRNNTGIYAVLNAKVAPSPTVADKLAKLMGIPPSELRERRAIAPPPKEPATQQLVQTKPRIPAEVLSFVANDAAEVRIRLDVTMPYDQGVPVFRMLLDAGLIATREEAEA